MLSLLLTNDQRESVGAFVQPDSTPRSVMNDWAPVSASGRWMSWAAYRRFCGGMARDFSVGEGPIFIGSVFSSGDLDIAFR